MPAVMKKVVKTEKVSKEAALPRPELGEYPPGSGKPLINLTPDKDRFPFQFGLSKAKLIVAHFPAIKKFVETEGEEC